ncbi:MAG: hypothetical protein ABIH09_00050 [Candidatus Omnitrophota bacterium]
MILYSMLENKLLKMKIDLSSRRGVKVNSAAMEGMGKSLFAESKLWSH